MLVWGLFISFFLLFYSLTVGEFPEPDTVKGWTIRYGFSVAGAVAMFFLGMFLTGTALAGLFWGILGWLVPGWIIEYINNVRQSKYQEIARNLVVTSAGMFAAGQLPSEVLRATAERVPEPFKTELQQMVGRRKLDPHASIPKMFMVLANKYNLPEFKAMASVIAAAERAGGPISASRGLKRLGQALRLRDKLIHERNKSNFEPAIAAIVTIGILAVGILLDITVWRGYFEGPGKIVLALSSALLTGMALLAVKTVRSNDLKG